MVKVSVIVKFNFKDGDRQYFFKCLGKEGELEVLVSFSNVYYDILRKNEKIFKVCIKEWGGGYEERKNFGY